MQYNLATAHAIRGEYDKAMANLVEVNIFISSFDQKVHVSLLPSCVTVIVVNISQFDHL